MRIAFLGTRGIPNNYGGFEQFAEYLSVGLAQKGHEITVYNPHFHPYKEDQFKGVAIRRIYSPENLFGAAANYIYDFLCLRDALGRNFDIIYEAGYGSVAFSYLLLPIRKSLIVTNMDGLEWKRAKWGGLVKYLTKKAEEVTVKKSHVLISDNPGIQDYYIKNFNRDSYYLPYGASLIEQYEPDALNRYNVQPNSFYILIARMEPENNIEMILEGYTRSAASEKLILIGNTTNAFGKKMMAYQTDNRICFIGGLYNKEALDTLRHFAKGYFHGHSVGGTNPSLLEAMASESLILAHKNPFNESVLGEAALYFENADEVSQLVNNIQANDPAHAAFKKINKEKIASQYEWNKIIQDHEDLFGQLVTRK
jgi:glycosyltransferase involved in cell wall biosynthesis